ncbi:J domain-containing protein-like isoform X2 [Sitophilus oryzae]|uniref:J domain-containing protein n=1 Tax=Sitophilus oryzae TaxID=7048 RepID=A0A6J2Y149_SITOR|nr:J domain-containing protein-like isoform X1 [Sitophilus oryzae]XP_030756750.1 J domain-containing protein-like isoform X2 [Sitophilus oryzae]
MSTTVGDILNYKKSEKEDYYAILGCDEHSSVEQISQEYKVRALQYHPDKNSGDKTAEEKFQLLNEAKDTLTNPEKKALYDKWRNSGISMGYKQWLGMKEHVQQSMHWSTPKTKDRMLESGGNSGPSSLGSSNVTAAQRRASEGGANLHWGGRSGTPWGAGAADAHSEVAALWSPSKTKKSDVHSGGSGPSSLTVGGSPGSYRRASEGGANLFLKTRKNKPEEKSHQI